MRGDGSGWKVNHTMALGMSPAKRTTDDVARALDPAVTGVELLPLAVHRDPAVRVAVASRTDCPMGALLALGHDRSPEVLSALIRNARAPETLIRQLAEHKKAEIRDAALMRLKTTFR